MTSPKVALIETKPSNTDFYTYFDEELIFDTYQLCSDPNIKKVLKRDVDLEFNHEKYDWVILVGSDSLKYFTKINSVTAYSGKKVAEKFLPIINPAMLVFKPEAKRLWDDSKRNIKDYIKGNIEEIEIDDTIAFGISDDTEACNEYLKKAIASDTPYVAVDTETTALYPRDGYLQGVSVCFDGEQGCYMSSECFDETTEQYFQQLFDNKTIIFHNAKFDIPFIEYHLNVTISKFEDTMLLHYLIDENPGTHGLKHLALYFTPYGEYEKPLHEWIDAFRKEHRILKNDFRWEWIPFETMYPYAAMDALCTFKIYEKFVKIKQNPKLKSVYDNILIPGCRFLVDVESNGVPFSRKRLEYATELMQKQIDKAIKELYKHPEIKEFEKAQEKDFNPNSVVQLRTLLFDYLKLKPTGKKTGTGQHSTDVEVLTALSKVSDVPKLIMDIRKKSKIKNTYLDKILPQLDRDDRIRTGFNQHSTTSGRLSSSGKMNMQQIPRDNPIVKGCIKARKGYKIVAMDLTTAEVYVAAVLSNDEALMDVFREKEDFHSAIAKRVFHLPCEVEEVAELYPVQRQAAKAVTFGIMYGAGPSKISEQVTKDSGKYFSVAEATEVINNYFSSFYKLRQWIDKNEDFIESNGFIYSCFGRKRRLPNVASKDRGIASHNVRSGLNFLVQSAASDINMLGAIDANNQIKQEAMDAKIFALVHDSILAEVKDEEVDSYIPLLRNNVQKDRGVSIPGTPIGCDFLVGDDYSFGKFEKEYAN
jgi:DNA polymerase I-like protein with 3'-5' exonuclease and polymerase domains